MGFRFLHTFNSYIFVGHLFVLSGCSFIAHSADSLLNPVSQKPPYTNDVTAQAQGLHPTLFIGDLHADTLLWERNLLKKHTRGHADIPRLIEGNVGIQAFTVFTKIPLPYYRLLSTPWLQRYYTGYAPDVATLLAIAQLGDNRKRGNLFDRAIYYAERLQKWADQSQGKFTVIRSQHDLQNYLAQRASRPDITAGFLGLEGAHALGDASSRLQDLYNEGYRMVGLVHFFDNAFAGSSSGDEKGGLNAAGKQLIGELGTRHMILDLAHASPQTIDDVLNLYDHPPSQLTLPALVVSHTGIKGTCHREGLNLADSHIQRIGHHDGLIGVGLWDDAVCGRNVEQSVDAIARAVQLAGVDHVALGSDFDGAVQTHFDARGMPLVTNALLLRGFSEADIRKIMGENLKQFLQRHLPL